METNRKKIGLALGSGGAKGIAHIGVLKALVKNNIPISFIAGTSIGAFIGAHFALYQDLEKLENIVLGQKREKLAMLLEPTLKGGFIKGKKVEKLLHLWLNDADFKDVKIPLQIVATDLITGEEVILNQGKIVPAVRASVAVPSIISPYEHNNRILVDGGLSNPVPDNITRQMGADIVIAVNLDKCPKNVISTYKDITLIKAALRTVDIMRHSLARLSSSKADIVIAPEIEIVGLKSWTQYFTQELGPRLIRIGEAETEKIIAKIQTLIGEN